MFAVYVSHAGSGEIRVLRLDANGALDAVQNVELGGQVMPMALSPDRRFLYAARRSAPLAVASFSIDPTSGALTALGEARLPHSMAYLATDRSGRWLFCASYGDDRVAVAAIGADGVAGAPHQVLATGRHAHAIQADPSNRVVYATALGAGVMVCYRFEPEHGLLTPADPPVFIARAGASPRHFVFSLDGRFIYLLNELDARIDVISREAGSLRTVQTVDTLPTDFAGVPWAADLHLAPGGTHLVASERRSSTLVMFDVDTGNGRLTLKGRCATESEPRGFAVTPDGRFVVVAGQSSGRIAVLAMAPHLRPVGAASAGAKPNWVEIVALSSRSATG